MPPNLDGAPVHRTFPHRLEDIRQAVNQAQSECVCQLHLCFCLLTDSGEPARMQPFLYVQDAA